MLKVQEKIGFGASTGIIGAGYIYEIAINSNLYLTNPYNIYNEALALSIPVDQPSSGAKVRLALGPWVRIINAYGSTSDPVITRGTGWGAGWGNPEIYVAAGNTAYLVGRGGAGGQGAESSAYGRGTCGGGGGGAAGYGDKGDGGGTNPITDGANGLWFTGGAGGIGNRIDPGTVRAAGDGDDGGPCIEAPNVGEDIDLVPQTGATLCVWPGGGAGGGGYGSGNGGSAGDATKAGNPGTGLSPGAGGSPGAHYIGNGTVNEVGPGTIDKDGP